MRFLCIDLRAVAVFAGVCACSAFGGCGNSCVVGYSVNGTGGVIVKAGNPPPVCTLNQAQGMVRAAMVKTPECVDCAPGGRVQHFLVVLRGMQIHSEGDGDGWVDLAPGLAASPRSVDLLGDSLPQPAVISAVVPAGSYDTLRLEFASQEVSIQQEDDFGQGQCGNAGPNCLVMDDGRREPLSFAGGMNELLIPLTKETTALAVLPDSTSELQIQLGARQSIGMSPSGGGKWAMQVIGEVAARRVIETN